MSAVWTHTVTSDHRLIACNLDLRLPPKSKIHPRLHWQALKHPEIRAAFTDNILQKLSPSPPHAEFSEIVRDSSSKTIPDMKNAGLVSASLAQL